MRRDLRTGLRRLLAVSCRTPQRWLGPLSCGGNLARFNLLDFCGENRPGDSIRRACAVKIGFAARNGALARRKSTLQSNVLDFYGAIGLCKLAEWTFAAKIQQVELRSTLSRRKCALPSYGVDFRGASAPIRLAKSIFAAQIQHVESRRRLVARKRAKQRRDGENRRANSTGWMAKPIAHAQAVFATARESRWRCCSSCRPPGSGCSRRAMASLQSSDGLKSCAMPGIGTVCVAKQDMVSTR